MILEEGIDEERVRVGPLAPLTVLLLQLFLDDCEPAAEHILSLSLRK